MSSHTYRRPWPLSLSASVVAAFVCCHVSAQTFTTYRDSTISIVAEHDGQLYAMSNVVKGGRMQPVSVAFSGDGLVMVLDGETAYQSVRWLVGGSSSSVHLFPYVCGTDGLYVPSAQFLCTNKTGTSLQIGKSDGQYKFVYKSDYDSWGFDSGKSYYRLALKHSASATEFMAENTSYFTSNPDLYTPAHNAGLAEHVFCALPTDGSISAICLPKGVRAAEKAGAQLYEVTHKVVDKGAVVGFVLKAYGGALAAGRPVIARATTAAGTFTAVVHGTATEEPRTSNGLVGTFRSTVIPSGCFAVTPYGLLPADELDEADAVAAANSAYIDPSLIAETMDTGQASEYVRLNVQSKLVVAVSAARTDGSCTQEAVYDLAARRVPTSRSTPAPHRGIYIIDGRKVAVR